MTDSSERDVQAWPEHQVGGTRGEPRERAVPFACSSFLGFSLSGRRHAVPMEAVSELLYLPLLQPTEGNTGALLGYSNLRGESIPVLDLALLLGLPERRISSGDVLLVFSSKGGLRGLMAEEVEDLLEFDEAELRKPKEDPGAEDRPPFVRALARKGERLYHLLDLEALEAAARTQDKDDRYDALFGGLDPQVEARLRQRASEALELRNLDENLGHACMEILLGGEAFAIPLKQIRQIMHFPPIFPVPGTPAAILGLASYRGEPLVVADIRPLLGIPQASLMPDARLLVIQDGAGSLGIYAEAAGNVVDIVHERLRPHPIQDGQRLLEGEWLEGDRLSSLISLQALLEHPGLSIRDSEFS